MVRFAQKPGASAANRRGAMSKGDCDGE